MEKEKSKNNYVNPYCDYNMLFGDVKELKIKQKKAKAVSNNFDITKALKNSEGIRLDVGCGDGKQKGFVGLDIRPLPGVDIVWDLEQTPYPLPDECCRSIVASHVVEHINPHKFGLIRVFNEWWRIMKPNGRLMIACPYGVGRGYIQDPTHTKPINQSTFEYFDPCYPSGLWAIYQPLPWKIVASAWHADGNLEVVLEKMPKEDVIVNGHQIVVDKKWANVKLQIRNSDKY